MRDIVEDAQQFMNDNKATSGKAIMSQLCNEVISLRAEIERLKPYEGRLNALLDKLNQNKETNSRTAVFGQRP